MAGAYETVPAPGCHYQSWMPAEVPATDKALAGNTSTERLSSPDLPVKDHAAAAERLLPLPVIYSTYPNAPD